MVTEDYHLPVIAVLADDRFYTIGISLATAKRVWTKTQKGDIKYRTRKPIVGPVCFKHLLVSLPIARMLES